MKQSKITLKNLFKFEFISFMGRLFLNRKPPIQEAFNYLNLGCGKNIEKGFINADFFRGSLCFWKKRFILWNREIEWMLDFRYPLNCSDDCFDGVFTEHTLEHLYPDELYNLLKELYRIMKKGATLRITVPDLEKYVDYYNVKDKDNFSKEFSSRFSHGADAIRNLTQNHHHRSLWDSQNLSKILEDIGFLDIQHLDYRTGNDTRLLIDNESRRWETLYVEAKK